VDSIKIPPATNARLAILAARLALVVPAQNASPAHHLFTMILRIKNVLPLVKVANTNPRAPR